MKREGHSSGIVRAEAARAAFLAALCAFIVACAPGAGRAAETAFENVTLPARVVDRRDHPVAGVRLRFDARLSGAARSADNRIQSVASAEIGVAVTNENGEATFRITPPPGVAASRTWFRGKAQYQVRLADENGEIKTIGETSAARALDIPNGENDADERTPCLCVFEKPDAEWDGFPVWFGRNGAHDRVIVILESFDLYNNWGATHTMRLIGGVGDVLRNCGIAVMVVNFPDSHNPPDALAPIAARAVRSAAARSGHAVTLAGLSAGGVVARWASVTAENEGNPLPINALFCLDSPNRGANMNPQLQAMILRYGKQVDRDAIQSASARALLTGSITDMKTQVRWRRVGLPPGHREVPAECRPDSRAHQDFYARLRRLNDRNGYPKLCRIVGVANSSRRGGGGDAQLLHLWLPLSYFWTLQSSEKDRESGSLLPPQFLEGFRVYMPFGIAGSFMYGSPTFVSAASALDAGPDETPPFDAWYARPDGLPAIPHDQIDAGPARFVIRELLNSFG